MIPSFIILSLIYLCVVGYSIFLKRFFFNKNINLDFYNLDFFYGISFIILLGCLINFFLPLKVFSNFIILVGFLLFLFFYNKTNFKFNIKIIFILIFFFLFISVSHSQVGDSAWYHLQNIKWVSDFKISFGLANLEPRYAYNSLIYIFLSALNIEIGNLQTKYILSILFYSVFFGEAFTSKLNNLSIFFIFLSKIFLLIFSLIHPDVNGVLFNYIGSIEVDNLIIFFYFISIYLYLKINNENYKKDDIYILVLISVLSITFKITSLPLIIFFFFMVYKFQLPIRLKFFLLLILVFWLLRGFIQSGCFIFPIKYTCFDVMWSIKQIDLNYFYDLLKSYPRSAPSRIMWGDFDYTLRSFFWVKSWFYDYFLNASMIKILIIILFSSIIALLIFLISIKNYYKTFINIVKKNYIIFIVLIISLVLWLQSPEIRYGTGQLISSILLFFLLIFYTYLKKMITFFKISNLHLKFIFILFILIIIKNYQNYSYIVKYYTIEKDYDYSNFKLVDLNNTYIFYNSASNNFCYDFKEICVLDKTKKYFFKKSNGYFFFYNF